MTKVSLLVSEDNRKEKAGRLGLDELASLSCACLGIDLKDVCYKENEALVSYLAQNNFYVISALWVSRWRDELRGMGLESAIEARHYFQSSSVKVVVLINDLPVDENSIAALADYIGLPYEVIDLGVGIVKNSPMLPLLDQDLSKKYRQDMAELTRWISRVSKLKDESQLIQASKEILSKVMHADSVAYVEVEAHDLMIQEGSSDYTWVEDGVVVRLLLDVVLQEQMVAQWLVELGSPIVEESNYSHLAVIINHTFTMNLSRIRTMNQVAFSNAQVIYQEKMASIGQMAGGVAHEINNPLGYIVSNLETLERYYKKYREIFMGFSISREQIDEKLELLNRVVRNKDELDYMNEEVDEIFDEIQSGTDRIKAIVNRFRSFTNVDELSEIKALDLNKLIQDIVFLFRSNYGDETELITEYGAIPMIRGNQGALNLTIYDLMKNAVEAIGQVKEHRQGVLSVKTYSIDQLVVIEIRDNGIGFNEDSAKRLFEPFYTNKSIGKGVGLGLTYAYEVVTMMHGGTISLSHDGCSSTLCRIEMPS